MKQGGSKIDYLSHAVVRHLWRGLINYAYSVETLKSLQQEINLRDISNWKSRRLNCYRFLYEKAFRTLVFSNNFQKFCIYTALLTPTSLCLVGNWYLHNQQWCC
jgi:hypothetical protein